MALNLDLIRNLKVGQGIVYNEKTNSLEKAGFRHWLGCTFGTAAAKARNEATLNAIRTELLTNPKYANVRLRVGDMLSGINTSRKINSGQVINVLSRLDELSSPAGQRKILMQRVTGHLASADLPECWKAKVPELTRFFERNADVLIADAGKASAVDIGKVAGMFAFDDIADACSTDGRLDSELFDCMAARFLAMPEDYKITGPDRQNMQDRINAHAEGFRNALAELRELEKSEPGSGIVQEGVRLMNDPAPVPTSRRLACMAENLRLTPDETERFKRIADFLIEGGVHPEVVLKDLADETSIPRRLMPYPALSSDGEKFKAGLAYMKEFDAYCAANKTNVPGKGDFIAFGDVKLDSRRVRILEKLVMEDFVHAAAGGKVSKQDFASAAKPFAAFLSSAQGGATGSLLNLPIEYRRPVVAALQTFNSFDDVALINRVISNLEEIVKLYAAKNGDISAEEVFRIVAEEGDRFPSDKDELKSYFTDKITLEVTSTLMKRKDPNAIATCMSLMIDYGVSLDDAHLIYKGELPLPPKERLLNSFQPCVCQRPDGNVDSAVAQLQIDLNRMNAGYRTGGSKGPKVLEVKPGSDFSFNMPNGRVVVLNSHDKTGFTEEQKKRWLEGWESPVSEKIASAVFAICGNAHPRQMENVLLALTQGGLGPLRAYAVKYGIAADEHSQVKYDVRRLDNGDVTVKISQPEGCPLEFNWTFTFGPDGSQEMSDVYMKRAGS